MYSAYTDGACKTNPGRGGWGWLLYESPKLIFTDYGGKAHTTNNEMELTAIIELLKELSGDEGVECTIHSDSKYCVNAFGEDGKSGWMKGWKRNGWKRSTGELKNCKLWKKAWKLINSSSNTYNFVWVKGHSNNKYNDMADELANAGVP